MEKIVLKPDARILVTRLDRIGDFVLSTPVFEALRKKFPHSKITAMTFSENRDLILGNPFIDDAVFYDKKGSEKGWLGNFRFARKLARRHFDLVVHLHATNRVHWVGFLAGIPVRIGWTRKCAWALTHGLKDIKAEGRKHESEYNFELLQLLGVDCPADMKPCFVVQEDAVRSVDLLLKRRGVEQPFIALNPTASCPSKMWPYYRFTELAAMLWQTYKQPLVITGGPADRTVAQKICAGTNAPVIDLTGELSLGMLGALMQKAELLVSNDTGPVHIAAAVGTPVVSIFGRNQPGLSPLRWKPLGEKVRVVWKDTGCNPCLAHDCHIAFLCLDIIRAQDVFDAAADLLAAGAGVR